jgi:hypothetical protein
MRLEFALALSSCHLFLKISVAIEKATAVLYLRFSAPSGHNFPASFREFDGPSPYS